MHNAGVAFRARYINATACAATDTCLPNGIYSYGSNGSRGGENYGFMGQPGVG